MSGLLVKELNLNHLNRDIWQTTAFMDYINLNALTWSSRVDITRPELISLFSRVGRVILEL